MKHPTSEPNKVSSNSSKSLAQNRLRSPLVRILFALIIIAFLSFMLILYLRTADNKADQKLSQEFRKDLIDKGSMADSAFLAGAGEVPAGDAGATVAPEEKATPNDENNNAVVAQENKEDNPVEKVVENNPKTVPTVKKDTTKATTVAKLPTILKKEISKAISCKDERDGKDHPKNSTTKGKHRDEDCCPDPDEWPKPGCVYSQKALDLMLSGPPKKKK